jgi:hypothetical protein
MRPGDAVVLDGAARIFNGSSQYPFRSSDFRDFRQSEMLTSAERKKIDKMIGNSFLAEAKRNARREARLREASLKASAKTLIDIPMNLRSGFAVTDDLAYFADGQRGPVRVIAPGVFSGTK